MSESTERATLIRRYLLGQVSVEQRAAFEDQYLADDNVFEELAEAENDLIDDYVRSRLSADERTQFLNLYLTTQERHERVEFAQALFKHSDGALGAYGASIPGPGTPVPIDDLPPVPIVRPGVSQMWRGLIGISAVLVVVASIWLVVLNGQLKTKLNESSTQHQELQGKVQNLQNQITQLKAQLEGDSWPIPAAGQAVMTIMLSPKLERGGDGSGNLLHLPSGVAQTNLMLKRAPDEHLVYSATLETVEGLQVWKGSNLPKRNVSDATIVVVTLPTAVLRNGDYILRLSGINNAGKTEELAPYAFRVETR